MSLNRMSNKQNLKPAWKKGESGNPEGRPKGSKSLKTRLLEALYESDKPRIDKIIESVFKQAEKGNIQAIKLIFDYLDKYDFESGISNNEPETIRIEFVDTYTPITENNSEE